MPTEAGANSGHARGVPVGGFGDRFDSGERNRIEAVLNRLAFGEGAGRWSGPPDRIDVEGRYDDGTSGTLVVGLTVKRGSRLARHVAKIGPPAVVREEWHAFDRVLRDRPSILCPPIVVVSWGVLDEALEDTDEVVVYTDVKEFAGGDGEPVNFETLVEGALADPAAGLAAAVAAVRLLLHAADQVFYKGSGHRDRRDRMDAKAALGPDLRIEVNSFTGAAWGHDSVPERDWSSHVRTPGDVVEAGLQPPGAPDGKGGYLALRHVSLERRDGRWLAVRDDAVIDLGAPLGQAGETITPGPLALVHGRILGGRSQDAWDHAVTVLPGLAATASGQIEYEGITTADPFAALGRVLREEVSGILAGTAHGDLNPKNALFVDDRPYLIDYARAGRAVDVPVLRDPAWLELNLLRRPVAGRLSYAGLVRVQRLLLLGDRVATLLPPDGREAVDATLAGLAAEDDPVAGSVVRVLAAVRRGAQRVHGSGAEPWWSGYQRELLLAAHRAAKWREDRLEPWQAHISAAAVAAEALAGPGASFLDLWSARELAAAATAVLPLLPSDASAVPLLGEIVAALARGGVVIESDPPLADVAKACRERVVAAVAATVATGESRAASERYMDLGAIVGASPRDVPTVVSSAAVVVLETPRVVVVGAGGTGKSTLLGEVAHRLTGRLTARVSAAGLVPGELLEDQVEAALARVFGVADGLLAANAVHVLVDDLHRTLPEHLPGLLAELREFGRRHPRVPVTVAARDPGTSAALPEWTVVELEPPEQLQATRYLVHAWCASAAPGSITTLVDTAIEVTEPGAFGVRKRSPLLLSMLAALPATWFGRGSRHTAGDVLHAYYGRLLPASARPAAEMAEDLAARLTETGAGFVVSADLGPTGLVESGVLVADGGRVGFASPDVQDYFAARQLLRDAALPGVLERVGLDHRWYRVCEVLVSLSTTPSGVRRVLIRQALRADPVFGARLLAACPASARPKDLALPFLEEQRRVLRDPEAGTAALQEAADALAGTGAPAAYRRLLEIVDDLDAPVDIRARCLRALTHACATVADQRHRSPLTERIGARCADLLSGDTAPDLLLAAIDATRRLRLAHLALLVTARVETDSPRPVLQAAKGALTELGFPQPQRTRRARAVVDAAALADLEHDQKNMLPAVDGGSWRLQRERIGLLNALPPSRRLPALLARRAAFEIGALVGVLIEETPAHEREPWLGPAEPPAALTDRDPLVAAAALHHALAEGSTGAARVFTTLAVPGHADHAAFVAQAVRELPGELLPDAVAFVHSLLPSLGALGDLEGVASLVHAIYGRDRVTGLRLARLTHRVLVALERRDRFRWPWALTLALCGGEPADLESLLASDDPVDHQIALDALEGHAFLSLALPGPDLAHPHVADLLREASGARLARVAAAVGLGEAIPSIQTAAEREGHGPAVTVMVGGALAEVSPAADLLAACGYLARTATGDRQEQVHRWLTRHDTRAAHPSVETGRLIGLAYLGDWRPLMDAVADGRPRCRELARNTLDHWLPGPCSADDGSPEDVARWITRRLAGPRLPAEVRSDLHTLRRQAEQHAGRATPRGN